MDGVGIRSYEARPRRKKSTSKPRFPPPLRRQTPASGGGAANLLGRSSASVCFRSFEFRLGLIPFADGELSGHDPYDPRFMIHRAVLSKDRRFGPNFLTRRFIPRMNFPFERIRSDSNPRSPLFSAKPALARSGGQVEFGASTVDSVRFRIFDSIALILVSIGVALVRCV